ncbi:SAICAR synthase-like protein [Viridothelium virens]|uniref:Kinase n=1 Tax=Viridothelium virens TaxID=1048519 RepID=A0A6A6GV52_VIRVR|nr:SAICAR synthase-like protein [Viridothelium virens]
MQFVSETETDSDSSSHGVLIDSTGDVVIKPCTEAEIDFYEKTLQLHRDFAAHMPTYMGQVRTKDDSNNDHHHAAVSSTPGTTLPSTALETETAIVLENLAAGFVRPNILDIKLGARLWADDAPLEKRARLDAVAASTTSGSLGFRVAGMRVWRGRPAGAVESEGRTDPEAGYQIYDRTYGRNFNTVTVKTAFDEFFLPADYACDIRARRHVVEKCVRELGELQEKLEKMECRMYSASILCVYEGDNSALDAAIREERFPGRLDSDEESSEPEVPKVATLKLIDFAHAKWTPGFGPDENLLQGVRSVHRILEDLLASSNTNGPTSDL